MATDMQPSAAMGGIRRTTGSEIVQIVQPPRNLTGAMISPVRSSRLAPRLVLLFAVLTCLLGLGQTSSVAQTADMAAMPAVASADSGRSAHQMATPAQATDEPSAPSPASGRGGHGGDAGHAMDCMSATAVAALGAIALAGAADLISPVLSAPISGLHAAVLAVSYPRPPDITTPCVQRI